MKTALRKDFFIIAVFLSFFFSFCFLFLMVSLRGRASSPVSLAPYSVFDSGKKGCRALYLLLKALDLPVATVHNVSGFTRHKKGSLVFIGNFSSYDNEKMAFVKKWVKQGNNFLVFSNSPRYSGMRTDDKGQKRKDARQGSYSAHGALHGDFLLKKCSARMILRDKGFIPLISDNAGAVAAVLPEGKGKIVFVACTFFLTNKGLQDIKHAFFTANFLKKNLPDGAGMYFDEETRGFYGRTSWVDLLKKSPLGWGLLHVLFAVLLWVYYKGRRFGAPLQTAFPAGTWRETTEHIDAFAHLFRSAHAGSFSFSRIRKDFRERMCGNFFLPSGMPDDVLLARAQERKIKSIERLEKILRQDEHSVTDEKQLFHAVCEMDEILLELKPERKSLWQR